MNDRASRISALGYDYAAQPKQAVAACNLCGTSRWVVITHVDRYGYPARATTCSQCGCTQLNPRMTSEAYTDFYIGTYRPLVSAFHGRLIDAQSIQGEQREYAAAMIEWVKPFLTPEHKTLLDVGGSTGVISAEFNRAFGMQCTVIDPAPAEIAEAEALGIRTITGFIEDLNPADAQYDFVAMFQTIDHLLDVAATLKTIRTLLPAHGLFLVDIVDFRAAYLRNRSVEMAVKIDHVYSLTEMTTEAYLARFGFEWIEKSYSADHLHVAYLCRPCEPQPDALPGERAVKELLREIRAVQNTPA